MEKYVIINRISKMTIWTGTMSEAKQICFNPFIDETSLKMFANCMGNDLYKLVK